MAEVLSFPSQPDGASHFGSSSLQRSASHSSLLLQNSAIYHPSTNNPKPGYSQLAYDNRLSNSLPSSAPSSPRLSQPQSSNQPSYISTPSSSLSLDEHCLVEDEDIRFPSYADELYIEPDRHVFEPPSSPEDSSSLAAAPCENVASRTGTPRLSRAGSSGSAGDDMNIQNEPSRHVDYLSHNWKEEDIWSSWRHVVARRKVYGNSTRLENASWRTWAKSKYRLKTVSPETLNWMKDHDVTWLYGPLQTDAGKLVLPDSGLNNNGLSCNNSFGSMKPILKKRSLSELMLHRSISSSTLIQQATDALKAQQPGQRLRNPPVLRQGTLSDYAISSNHETPSSPSNEGGSSILSSTMTSGRQTPCTKRHIHFNNKVEQCIAINDGPHERCRYGKPRRDDSESEDDVLMMKPVANKVKVNKPRTPRSIPSNEGKTIAMLPSTTLKYRGDTPDPVEQQEKQKDGPWNKGIRIPQSPSQETIKPSSPSSNFLIDDDDEEMDMNWQPSAGRRDSIFLHHSHMSGSELEEDCLQQRNGLRRTPSGMFMPYDDDDDDAISTGFLGKVIDTVNTAKDIAHVIWNVAAKEVEDEEAAAAALLKRSLSTACSPMLFGTATASLGCQQHASRRRMAARIMADGPQPKRCNFFLWDDEAKSREAAAVLSNSRTEPVSAPQTPTMPSFVTGFNGLQTPHTDTSKRYGSSEISTPYTPSKSSAAPRSGRDTQETSTTIGTSDEEFYDWPTSDDEDVLRALANAASARMNMPPPETPCKTIKNDPLSSPGKRRFSEMANGGEITWPTLEVVEDDVFSTPSTTLKKEGNLFIGQPIFCPTDTPTPRRFKDVPQAGQDSELTVQILKILQDRNVTLNSDVKAELKAVCDKHSLSTRGIMKGRDVSRAMVCSKNESISELQETIAALQAERETSRAHLPNMQLPALSVFLIFIGRSIQLNLPLPNSLPVSSNLQVSNATTEPSRKWPAVPWTFTGLLNGRYVVFNEYGRRLHFQRHDLIQIDEGALRISQALKQTFHPREQPVEYWPYARGVVNFWLELIPENPATRAEILDLFDWILILMREVMHAPREINRALLLDAGKRKAFFSLTFPGIAAVESVD
ncbi:MAG: hypothetical protein Q9186_005411 [Xanthomendoza sp. 1 TL-2023]